MLAGAGCGINVDLDITRRIEIDDRTS